MLIGTDQMISHEDSISCFFEKSEVSFPSVPSTLRGLLPVGNHVYPFSEYNCLKQVGKNRIVTETPETLPSGNKSLGHL